MMNQVVLSPSADGSTDLHIGQVDTGISAPTAAGSELHLGSQDLIRFASYASTQGFVVSSFMLADAYLVPLGEEEQAQVSAEMLEALRLHGDYELEAAMRDEYAGLYVVGVNLIASSSAMRISVRRRGYVETSIVEVAERLLASAWRELRLS